LCAHRTWYTYAKCVGVTSSAFECDFVVTECCFHRRRHFIDVDMNFERYPWLSDLSSPGATSAIEEANASYQITGAVIFPGFLSSSALESCKHDALLQESTAFTTDDVHTAYLRPINQDTDLSSVENLETRTQVASIAFDELPENSVLGEVYKNPTLRSLVARIVGKKDIYLSEDPLGCCSINVFRPGYHHSFHFDESEFSVSATWLVDNNKT
jgi:hypothetical protein